MMMTISFHHIMHILKIQQIQVVLQVMVTAQVYHHHHLVNRVTVLYDVQYKNLLVGKSIPGF